MKKIILLCAFAFMALASNAQFGYLVENFNTCDSTVQGHFPPNWYVYSVAGSQEWLCYPQYGVNNSPVIEMNGFQASADHANEDWLITPQLKISAYPTVTLNFFAVWKYAGDSLHIMLSTNYTGTGDPTASTWNELTHPQTMYDDTVNFKMFTCDLSSYKASPYYIGFKYTSTVSDGCRWDLDSVFITTNPSSTGIEPAVNIAKIPLTVIGKSTGSEIKLSFDVNPGLYKLSVCDIVGREVYEDKIDAQSGLQDLTISNINLSKGMYIVKLGNERSFGVAKAIIQ